MRRIVVFLTMIALMSACVKPEDPNEPTVTVGLKLSVLGDSFSSFAGTLDPDTNDPFETYPEIGVTEAAQMWWHKVATEMEWVLDKNNSFSGALVSNFDGFNEGSYYGPNSFIRRMGNLGNPDVIMVFGATNDIYKRAPLGDFIYDAWTDDCLETFRPALAYLFDNLQRQYPNAAIYFLLDMELCISDTTIDPDERQAYIESIHHISNHYNVRCIDIYGIRKSSWHPNVEGHADIARQVVEALTLDFNV